MLGPGPCEHISPLLLLLLGLRHYGDQQAGGARGDMLLPAAASDSISVITPAMRFCLDNGCLSQNKFQLVMVCRFFNTHRSSLCASPQ